MKLNGVVLHSDATFWFDRLGGEAAGRHPDIEALVQHVEITDDPERAASGIAQLVPGTSIEDILRAPFLWIGTPDQIASQVLASKERWGINRYVVRGAAMESVGPIVQLLGQSN